MWHMFHTLTFHWSRQRTWLGQKLVGRTITVCGQWSHCKGRESERNGGRRISASQQTFVTVTFTLAYAQSLQKSYPVTISGLTSRLPWLDIRSRCSFCSLGAQCTKITSSLPSTHPMGKVEQKHDNYNKHLPRRIVRQKTVTVPQQFRNISEESCKNSCSKSRECYSFKSFCWIPGYSSQVRSPSWLLAVLSWKSSLFHYPLGSQKQSMGGHPPIRS